MMIHVFYVNQGDMHTFDVSNSFERVERLQQLIAKDTKIPIDSQVLMISGGEAMSPKNLVCSYSAGTESCPIFLFSLRAIEEKNSPEIYDELETSADISQRVDGSLQLPANLNTLSSRTQLALDLKDEAEKYIQKCKVLVHHQHLQHQGWKTVVANLEDTTKSCVDQADKFSTWYKHFIEKKNEFTEMLEGFPKSLDLLARIPILPSMCDFISKVLCNKNAALANPPATVKQLLELIERDVDLMQESQQALQEINQMNMELLAKLLDEKDNIIKTADNEEMKEIKGLEDRLYGLDQLVQNAEKIAQDQALFAQSFQKNQAQWRRLNDVNILKELCQSHKDQLKRMEEKDSDMRRILSKIRTAKQELNANLHHRLRWIMYVENKISAVDGRITLHYESSRRLKLHIDKLSQINQTPVIYSQLCTEICRRKLFDNMYKKWGDEAYHKTSDLYTKEKHHRIEFFKCISQHFMKVIFPGLDKLPQTLMFSALSVSDEDLPVITVEDIVYLRDQLPELTAWLKVPDQGIGPNSNSENSASNVSSTIINRNSGSIPSIVSANSSSSTTSGVTAGRHLQSHPINTPQVEHLMSECESLCDNEEFVSLVDPDRAPSSLTDDNSGGFVSANFFLSDEVESITEKRTSDNDMVDTITMQNSVIEKLNCDLLAIKQHNTQLRDDLQRKGSVVSEELNSLKSFHTKTKQSVGDFCAEFQKFFKALATVPSSIQEETNRTQILKEHHTEVIRGLSREMSSLNERIEEVSEQKKKLQKDYAFSQAAVANLTSSLSVAINEAEEKIRKELTLQYELELEMSVDESKKKLEVAHKEICSKDELISSLQGQIAELNNRLAEVTNSRHSDLDNITRVHQEQLQKVLKEHQDEIQNNASTHQRKLEEVIREEENARIRSLEDLEMKLKARHEQEITALTKPLCTSSTNTDENFMEAELHKLKLQIEEETQQKLSQVNKDFEIALATQINDEKLRYDQEQANIIATMKESLQAVHDLKCAEMTKKHAKEKAEMERKYQEIFKPLSNSQMGDSVIAIDPTALKSLEDKLAEKESLIQQLQSQIETLNAGVVGSSSFSSDKVTVRGVKEGDIVLLCFDDKHGHYLVFNLSPTLHFLHSDCLKDLDLEPDASGRSKSCVLAQITAKEYCQAKKPQNRFRLAVGTKFYRVKAKPAIVKP